MMSYPCFALRIQISLLKLKYTMHIYNHKLNGSLVSLSPFRLNTENHASPFLLLFPVKGELP